MAKTGKKTTTSRNNTQQKENPEVFVLMREVNTSAHHVIRRSQAITSKKVQKLSPGDEIVFGERGARIRGVILLMGKLIFLYR